MVCFSLQIEKTIVKCPPDKKDQTTNNHFFDTILLQHEEANMNIDRTEVIYVSDDLTNVIKNDNEVSSLNSDVIFEEKFTDSDILDLNNSLDKAIKKNKKIFLYKYYLDLNSFLEKSINSTTKQLRKGIKNHEEYDFLTQKVYKNSNIEGC